MHDYISRDQSRAEWLAIATTQINAPKHISGHALSLLDYLGMHVIEHHMTI
jgi:hypothetical protein